MLIFQTGTEMSNKNDVKFIIPYYTIYKESDKNNSSSSKMIIKAEVIDIDDTIEKLYDLMDQQSYYGDVNFY